MAYNVTLLPRVSTVVAVAGSISDKVKGKTKAERELWLMEHKDLILSTRREKIVASM
jgi:hypothetical protein